LKTFTHIDARTIDEIALENQQLKEKLKYNAKCLNVKKNELKLHKQSEKFKEKILKPRVNFAFRINIDPPVTLDQQRELREILEKEITNQNMKLISLIMLNNFIYLKVNHPIVLHERYDLCTGNVAEQIDPKDFMKMQI
jgi:hypothetical protein